MMAETVALGAAYAAGLAVGLLAGPAGAAPALATRGGMAAGDRPGTPGQRARRVAACRLARPGVGRATEQPVITASFAAPEHVPVPARINFP